MKSNFCQKVRLSVVCLGALLTLSACGEKKEVYPAGTLPTKTEPPKTSSDPSSPVPAPAPAPTVVPAPTNGAPSQPPKEVPLPQPAPPAKAPPVAKEPPKSPVPPVAPPAAPGKPGNDAVNPDQLRNVDVEKRFTGMTLPNGLSYVGSAQDKLLTYLRLRTQNSPAESAARIRNREISRMVEYARISRDESNGQIVVQVKLNENSYLRPYVLTGHISKKSRSTSLQIIKNFNGVRTMGEQAMSGRMKCLDKDGGCETSLVTLQVGDAPKSEVQIVFRDSVAAVNVLLPDQRSGNPEFDMLTTFWLNSINQVNTDFKFQVAVMKSFEVVNGPSGFDVQIRGDNQQLIAFGGPLLAPKTGTVVKVPATFSVDLQDSFVMDGVEHSRFDLANTIGSGQIVNNNGVGQVRVSLAMRKKPGFAQDTMLLTCSRIAKSIVTLNEQNLKM